MSDTLTKRDLVLRISSEINAKQEKEEAERPAAATAASGRWPRTDRTHIGQQTVLEIIQKTLDYIAEALAKGDKVELRNFGVFEIKVRKARIGRNPHAPQTDVPIPARATVKFKAGKELRAEVLKLPTKPTTAVPASAPIPPAK